MEQPSKHSDRCPVSAGLTGQTGANGLTGALHPLPHLPFAQLLAVLTEGAA